MPKECSIPVHSIKLLWNLSLLLSNSSLFSGNNGFTTCVVHVWFLSTIVVLPSSVLYFDIYVCYMFNKITYLLTYLPVRLVRRPHSSWLKIRVREKVKLYVRVNFASGSRQGRLRNPTPVSPPGARPPNLNPKVWKAIQLTFSAMEGRWFDSSSTT